MSDLYAQALAKIEESIHKFDISCDENCRKAVGNSLALKSVLELHGAEVRYVNPEYEGSFDSEKDALDGWDLEIDGIEGKPVLTTFIVCAACGAINTAAMESSDDWDYLPEVYFPCRTANLIIKAVLGVTP